MTESSKRPDRDASDPETKLDRATIVSAFILLVPPGLAFAAAAFPGYVPVPFVDMTAAEGIRPLLAVTGLVLLVVNAAFLWMIRNQFDVNS